MRTIKFRQWHPGYKDKVKPHMEEPIDWLPSERFGEWMQFTGLKDKSTPCKDIYEDDIIDKNGKIIGNKYETPALLKDPTNLLIQGFGTKTWCTTYQKTVERGCTDTE